MSRHNWRSAEAVFESVEELAKLQLRHIRDESLDLERKIRSDPAGFKAFLREHFEPKAYHNIIERSLTYPSFGATMRPGMLSTDALLGALDVGQKDQLRPRMGYMLDYYRYWKYLEGSRAALKHGFRPWHMSTAVCTLMRVLYDEAATLLINCREIPKIELGEHLLFAAKQGLPLAARALIEAGANARFYMAQIEEIQGLNPEILAMTRAASIGSA